MLIHHAIAVARADLARIERFVLRRDRFLDCLDWSALTDTTAFEASMLDDLLDEELADAASYVDWLEELATRGTHELTHMIRFDPYVRPNRVAGIASALTFAPARASIAA
ncbi:hypothetical protein J2Y58_003891 [Sphingomonas sp. BE138]|uniref:hypothetical protein n=1 Tax=Sphingomonas sp. BE138 TaxID=2817845 RepID=UPI002855EAE7|nr:hypothetical protein [Sphingomonas sp. BE138]MDR6790508.1 hypothetical protein [Sphingomonas sp. BE138]